MPARPRGIASASAPYLPLVGFVGVCAVLVVVSLSLPSGPSRAVLVGLGGLGTAAVAFGVLWRRPVAWSGWWWLIAGLLAAVATAATGVLHRHTLDRAALSSPAPVLLATVAYLLITVALARLLWQAGAGGWAGMTEAAMTALVLFLVVWIIALKPLLANRSPPLIGLVFYLIALFLAAAMLGRLLLRIGLSAWPIGLAVGGLAALIGSHFALVLAGAGGSAPLVRAGVGLWLGFAVLIGAAGLHPALGRVRVRPASRVTGRGRILLYAVAVLLGPLAALRAILLPPGRLDRAWGTYVSLTVALALAMLLVTRVSQVARGETRRADELARTADELDRAVRSERTLREQLTYRALHDRTTGLGNGVVLTERLEWVLHHHAQDGPHTVVVLDLDEFKVVNDTLGRPAGDKVLVELAHRLIGRTPRSATLACLGGDEFAVLFEHTPVDDCLQWTEAVRHDVAEPYRPGGVEVCFTASAGVVTVDDGRAVRAADLLRDASLAVHTAKEQGGDRMIAFHHELRAARQDEVGLVAGLRRALACEELSMVYQPVVDLASDRPVAAEALVRWQPDGEPIPPDVFIPVAERSGLIRSIGWWTLHRACRDGAAWFRRDRVATSVNVSGRQLDDPAFADEVLAVLAESGLPPKGLILEITESTLVTTAADAVDQLRRLRHQGVRVAIDDFGTGYSSLASVAELPVDIIKVDKAFVRRPATHTRRELAFARAIVQLATSLHLPTIAEGVETDEQAGAMRRLRCTMAQGYLYSRPVPARDFDRLLTRSGGSPARSFASVRGSAGVGRGPGTR